MKKEQRKLMLHYWYVELCEEDGWYETEFLWARGVVSGHYRIQDSKRIHTSYIKKMEVNEEEEELVIYTKNSVYHCPLEYCDFEKQDKHADLIPNYEKIRAKYYGKRTNPSIEEGKVLLVVSKYPAEFMNLTLYHTECKEDI